ncbi:ABC transporter ATP-binding protein [Opitutus terrae]|uniref:ABC transporter related n=1 Tax=Opitutus terrae (strain DSM 11246 / JCM 15787 / PB90-1) TaxID=452637 RepID=B1ZYN0_OPITP|nr:ABC transporter ATP-binding protein [Opitutus terrae]ACB75266.1 ABC transporter related [Opitutus terrae PB90-1]
MPAAFHQEDEFRARLDAGLWWKIFRRALHLKRYLVPLLISAVGIAVCDATYVQITRWVIDGVARDGADAPFTLYIAASFGLTLAFAVAVWVLIETAGNIAHRLAHDIRRDCFDRLLSMELAFFDTRPAGWLIARLTADCNRLANVLAWGSLDFTWGLSYLVLVAISLLLMNWRLGLLVLAVVPLLALISVYFQRKMLLSAREVRRVNSQITAAFNESIQGVRTTKSLVREQANLAEFQHLSTGMFSAAVLNARQNALYFPLVTTLGTLGAGLALWRGGYLVENAELSLGTLVAFINFAIQFFHPINQLALKLAELQSAQAAGERVLGLLAAEPAIKDTPVVLAAVAHASDSAAQSKFEIRKSKISPLAPDGLPGAIDRIEFRAVSFRYATGPTVLRDFHLRVQRGDTVALVGASGGGKSTLVSLLCRFYEPSSGQILVNGRDYRERPLTWYQSQFGVVLQTPHLFQGTIRDNIRYGRLDATDAEVEAAARLVNADEFIRRLDHGYDTPVGEGGNRLSTGQRQLVSFARALLANPQVFVMDEATSSIDTETERLIQRGLETMFAGRIAFVIAHRLSTIRRASRILVIDHGRIAEAGTHDELLRQRGHYYQLYTGQFHHEREAAVLASADR